MGEGGDGNTDVAQLDPPARSSQLHRCMMGNPTARRLGGLKKQVNGDRHALMDQRGDCYCQVAAAAAMLAS